MPENNIIHPVSTVTLYWLLLCPAPYQKILRMHTHKMTITHPRSLLQLPPSTHSEGASTSRAVLRPEACLQFARAGLIAYPQMWSSALPDQRRWVPTSCLGDRGEASFCEQHVGTRHRVTDAHGPPEKKRKKTLKSWKISKTA